MHMVMHMKNLDKDALKAITVRIREKEYERLCKYASGKGVSLNSVVAEAVAQYEARLERAEVIEAIQGFQTRLRNGVAKTSDSVEILRRLRSGRCVSLRSDQPDNPPRISDESAPRHEGDNA